MTPPLGLKIYLGPGVTLNFDLQTTKDDLFLPWLYGPVVPTGINIIGLFVFRISCSRVL